MSAAETPISRAASEVLHSLLGSLEREPWAFDFHAVLRRIDAIGQVAPRFGESLRPQQDPIRLGQEPSLSFAPSAVSAFSPGNSYAPPRIEVRFFGFLGPNGPLPLHLTEFAMQRIRHHGDQTFARFLDLFHHRLLSLFHRSWAQAHPVVSMDRPKADPFSGYVRSIAGYGTYGLRDRDAVPDFARQRFSGWLARSGRSIDGVESVLTSYFGMRVRVEQFVGHWMRLQTQDLTRLGVRLSANRLGAGATLGERVWDRQYKIRLVMGPMTRAQYDDLLPGGRAARVLRDWMLNFFGRRMAVEVQLVLRSRDVPVARLGQSGALGWSAWFGSDSARSDASDLRLELALERRD
ncbi:MAG TPA: type VI secretion system baseplate subunit TssG [Burkholderiaceae bacterium]|nr:type VI secretion system baseplate subunit TssG [Burkholderiaceae bacterium]